MLVILQGMDAAGKDGVIKHVMSGINPQGCEVHSFKAPSAEELEHDFLWRCAQALPERGRIGIFNRSYYEEVLVVRVHPELLARQKLPTQLVAQATSGSSASRTSARFERHLARNGTLVLKFFLHISQGGAAPAVPRRGSRSRPSAGSSRWATSTSASCGTTTWTPTRT